ncbi:MAG: 4Fe-4S dicluster domain-containing protein [Opitutaceae bacterium]|jgi:glycolate oxidase iron-sulfur subunit|nr:4Fe-4S dicluster domain-containing protein [Opitutaceae bacterium]
MADAVSKCVHCGFCLAACPTYSELGSESESPRGRIVIMKEVLEGTLTVADAAPHVDACLGCLACEPACPSGVPYRDLISSYRAQTNPQRKRSFVDKLKRQVVSNTIPYPSRFQTGAKLGRLAKPLKNFLPKSFQPMLELLPDEALPPMVVYPPTVTPDESVEVRGRVALLLGCAQQALDPDINDATIEVLNRNGIEVVIPETQGCCGALSWHVGELKDAQKFAINNLGAFPADIDAIITNAAGCGSGIHEYPLILKGTSAEAAAQAMAERTFDITAYLAKLGNLAPISAPSRPVRIAYHDACHLANAQGVRVQPRDLLRTIPGVEIIEIPDGGTCCGSAGTYNIDQPEIAASLGRQKAEHIRNTQPEMIASGNIGCLTQLRTHLNNDGQQPIPIRHTIQILRDAYAGSL